MRRMYSQLELANIINTKVPQILYNEYGFYVEEGVIRSRKDASFELDLRVAGNFYAEDDAQFASSMHVDENIECDGDITAKTLKQTQANYTTNFTISSPDDQYFEVSGVPFCKIEEVNGEMHIIGSIKFHNKDTENAHQFTLGRVDIYDLPTQISSKIYDVAGITVSATGSNADIRIFPVCTSSSPRGQEIHAAVLHNVSEYPNGMRMYLNVSQSLNPNTPITISFEINLSIV